MSDNSRLKSFIDRIERLNEQKAALAADIKEVYQEAGSVGFNTKAVRALIKERAADAQARAELEETLDLYRKELGMLADTPLGAAALDKVP